MSFTVQEFRETFPPESSPPDHLLDLLAFQESAREWYSGSFELSVSRYGDASWFDGDADAAKEFAVFGNGPDGSQYALWVTRGPSLDTAPVVFFGSEGQDCSVLARNVDEFLALLAVGANELGFDAASGVISCEEPVTRLEEFRSWLQNRYGIAVPGDPMAVVSAARTEHPDLQQWIDDRLAVRRGVGSAPDGKPSPVVTRKPWWRFF